MTGPEAQDLDPQSLALRSREHPQEVAEAGSFCTLFPGLPSFSLFSVGSTLSGTLQAVLCWGPNSELTRAGLTPGQGVQEGTLRRFNCFLTLSLTLTLWSVFLSVLLPQISLNCKYSPHPFLLQAVKFGFYHLKEKTPE